MSKLVYEGKLFVNRHAGPASEGSDRARWQVTIPNCREYVTLGRAEVQALATALLASVAPDDRPA